MNRVGFGGRRQGHPGCPPGPLMEQVKERRGGHGGPGKVDKGENRQECRDWPY